MNKIKVIFLHKGVNPIYLNFFRLSFYFGLFISVIGCVVLNYYPSLFPVFDRLFIFIVSLIVSVMNFILFFIFNTQLNQIAFLKFLFNADKDYEFLESLGVEYSIFPARVRLSWLYFFIWITFISFLCVSNLGDGALLLLLISNPLGKIVVYILCYAIVTILNCVFLFYFYMNTVSFFNSLFNRSN